jgi:hypothetical protein
MTHVFFWMGETYQQDRIGFVGKIFTGHWGSFKLCLSTKSGKMEHVCHDQHLFFVRKDLYTHCKDSHYGMDDRKS